MTRPNLQNTIMGAVHLAKCKFQYLLPADIDMFFVCVDERFSLGVSHGRLFPY